MAEDKKSFVLYADLIHTVKKMPTEKQGQLFMTILAYVNDENPQVEDLLIDLVFEPIKRQMKRDLKKYEVSKEKRREAGRLAGLKSGEARKVTIPETNQCEPMRTIGSKTNQCEPNEHVTVTVNDTVTVTVNDTVIKENINTALPFKFFDSLILLGGDKQLVSDWIKVRKLKKLSNTQTAFNSFENELLKSKKTINEVLKECVINSWGGFKSEWINKKEVSAPTKKRIIS